MSGPKCSNYTVDEETRRRLAFQREKELRELAEKKRREEELRKKKQMIGSISFVQENIKSQVKFINGSINDEEINFIGEDFGLKASIEALKNIEDKVNALILKVNTDKSISELEEFKKEIDNYEVKVKEEAKQVKQTNQKITESYNIKTNNDISSAFLDTIEDKDESEEIISMLQEELRALEKASLSIELKEEVDNSLRTLENIDKGLLKDFKAVSIDTLVKKCQSFIEEQAEYEATYHDLMLEYEAYCEKSGNEKQNFSPTKMGIAYLKDAIENLKQAIQKEDEDAYIAKAIDEAMVEMGYDVLGYQEKTKKNGKHMRKDLYKYKDGTAVNVTKTSDGQIMMELGAIDCRDRLPSKQESEYLCQDMEAFCDDFKKIEAILKGKGVILKNRISLLPPAVDYAQIINTNDYNITNNVVKTQTKKKMRSEE